VRKWLVAVVVGNAGGINMAALKLGDYGILFQYWISVTRKRQVLVVSYYLIWHGQEHVECGNDFDHPPDPSKSAIIIDDMRSTKAGREEPIKGTTAQPDNSDD